MEHIVQFAIGIDDQGIKDVIQERASRQISDEISDKVREAIYGDYISDVSKFFSAQIGVFLDENKAEIIEFASEKLADKLSRTKAAREATARICKNISDQDEDKS